MQQGHDQPMLDVPLKARVVERDGLQCTIYVDGHGNQVGVPRFTEEQAKARDARWEAQRRATRKVELDAKTKQALTDAMLAPPQPGLTDSLVVEERHVATPSAHDQMVAEMFGIAGEIVVGG